MYLSDKDYLIELNENYDIYNKNNINSPKEFNYFNKDNTKLYLDDKEIQFNYKLILIKLEYIKLKLNHIFI